MSLHTLNQISVSPPYRSWDHMENHLKICKTYRDLYKTKLTTQPSKLSEAFKKDIEEHER